MKKIMIFLLLVSMLFCDKALALSVNTNKLTLNKGTNDKIMLYASSDTAITSVEFTLVYTSYDVQASFTPNNSYTYKGVGNNTHKVTFDEAKTGKILLGYINVNVKSNPDGSYGGINAYDAKGYTVSGDIIKLNSQTIGVSIAKEEVVKIDNNLLDRIDSDIVKIELKKDVFEYTVDVDSDVKLLDLKPIAKDSSTSITITNQSVDKSIVITAKNGDVSQEYVIKINVIKKEPVKEENNTIIDNSKFKANTSYKGKWILIFVSLLSVLSLGIYLSKKQN